MSLPIRVKNVFTKTNSLLRDLVARRGVVFCKRHYLCFIQVAHLGTLKDVNLAKIS